MRFLSRHISKGKTVPMPLRLAWISMGMRLFMSTSRSLFWQLRGSTKSYPQSINYAQSFRRSRTNPMRRIVWSMKLFCPMTWKVFGVRAKIFFAFWTTSRLHLRKEDLTAWFGNMFCFWIARKATAYHWKTAKMFVRCTMRSCWTKLHLPTTRTARFSAENLQRLSPAPSRSSIAACSPRKGSSPIWTRRCRF